MTTARLLTAVQPWMEQRLGVPLSALGGEPVPVVEAGGDGDGAPTLRAVKVGERGIVVASRLWADRLRPVVSNLHADLLFSVFGAFEMSRVTLPDGVGVWGPSWYLFADREAWRPVQDTRVVHLSPLDMARVDREMFWHCFPRETLAGFAIFERGELAALAAVRDEGEPVWEIGMDVVPAAKGRGLGRAVVSAAGDWILEKRRLVLATVAAFNVPSARTLRSVGLRYLFSEMSGVKGHFRVPPQSLGSPFPGAEVFNYYPDWAMNHNIRPRPRG